MDEPGPSDKINNDSNLKVDKILNIGHFGNKELAYLVTWTTGGSGFILRTQAIEKYPEKVIAFYEKNIKFISPESKKVIF